MTRSEPVDAGSIADRIHSASIHLLRALKSNEHAHGLSQAQLSALSVLYFTGSMTITALAKAEGVKLPTMSRLVKDMVAARLVTRGAHHSDARARVVRISRKGERRFEKAREARLHSLTRALDTMSAHDLHSLSEAARLMEQAATDVKAAHRPGDAGNSTQDG